MFNSLPIYDNRLPLEELKRRISKKNANDNFHGWNGLHTAALKRPEQSERFRLFLSHGTDVNSQNNNPLDRYANTPLHLLIVNENFDGTKFFISCAKEYEISINFNIKDKEGKTPLILAVKMNFQKAALQLLEEKANGADVDLDITDNEGNTALHYACALGSVEVVKALLTHQANIHALNKKGQSLIDMTQLNKEEIEQILRAVDIEPSRDENAFKNHFYDEYSLPFAIFTGEGQPHRFITLISSAANFSQLEKCLETEPILDFAEQLKGRLALMSQEKRKKMRDQYNNFSGRSVIDVCLERRKALLELLVKQGIHNDRIFRSAALNNEVKIVEEIYMARPDVLDMADQLSEMTALHYAALNGRLEMCQFLLSNKAKVDLRDSEKNTPLHLASKNGHYQMVQLLLKFGSDASSQNQKGKTPLELLTEFPHDEKDKNEKVKTLLLLCDKMVKPDLLPPPTNLDQNSQDFASRDISKTTSAQLLTSGEALFGATASATIQKETTTHIEIDTFKSNNNAFVRN